MSKQKSKYEHINSILCKCNKCTKERYDLLDANTFRQGGYKEGRLSAISDVEKILDETNLETFSDALHKEDIELVLSQVERFKRYLRWEIAKLAKEKL